MTASGIQKRTIYSLRARKMERFVNGTCMRKKWALSSNLPIRLWWKPRAHEEQKSQSRLHSILIKVRWFTEGAVMAVFRFGTCETITCTGHSITIPMPTSPVAKSQPSKCSEIVIDLQQDLWMTRWRCGIYVSRARLSSPGKTSLIYPPRQP